jgi:hypothetical protein
MEKKDGGKIEWYSYRIRDNPNAHMPQQLVWFRYLVRSGHKEHSSGRRRIFGCMMYQDRKGGKHVLGVYSFSNEQRPSSAEHLSSTESILIVKRCRLSVMKNRQPEKSGSVYTPEAPPGPSARTHVLVHHVFWVWDFWFLRVPKAQENVRNRIAFGIKHREPRHCFLVFEELRGWEH